MQIFPDLSTETSEEESNLYVTRTMLGGALLLVGTLVLNELDFYHIDKNLLRIATVISCLIVLFLEIFIHTYNHNKMKVTKYIVMGGVGIFTLCEAAVLNFFAIPSIVYPLLVGTHYHSRRINIYGIGWSCFVAYISPLLGIMLGSWDIKFFLWIVNLLDSSIIQPDVLANAMEGISLAGGEGLILFVALPNLIYVIVFGFLTFSVNISRRKRQEREINKVMDMQRKVVRSLADIIEDRDFNTGGHVKRTSNLVEIMVRHLRNNFDIEGSDDDEFFYDSIIQGAPLHDIGKITIPDEILCKPKKLTDSEFEKIKRHPGESARIIEQVLTGIENEKRLDIIKKMAKYHHEKYNGTGYPEGLKGDAIPFEARVMAIADVYDALVSERCYKEPKSPEEAYETIISSMGTHFDPKLEKCFKDSFEEFKDYYKAG